MSSTNRHNSQNRHVADYYVTPVWCIEDFLKAWLLNDIDFNINHDCSILDPCAGGDELHEMSYPLMFKKMLDLDIDTIDIREDSKANNIGDFITMPLPKYDIVITNPPFNIAIDIIKKALSVCHDGGYVIMLLRLNFLGSKQRKEFWDKNMPDRIYVHNKRISFTDGKQTDSIEYAHFVWKKGYHPKESLISII